ncbi:hypothetical protein [Terrisporobacter othiniensis]|nr:hypothetical protein [Terrisporobacter othiniensis]
MRTMPGPFLSPWGKMYKADIIRNNKIYFFSKIINYHFRGIIGNGGIKKRKKFDLVYDISSYHKEINKLLSKLKYNKGLKDFIESSFIEHYKLVFQKLILEESNISKADRNNVLKHLCKDNDFCNFLTHNKGRLRLYTLIKILVDIKCYNLSYFIIKNRLR